MDVQEASCTSVHLKIDILGASFAIPLKVWSQYMYFVFKSNVQRDPCTYSRRRPTMHPVYVKLKNAALRKLVPFLEEFLTLYVNWSHLSRTDQKGWTGVGGGARAVAGGDEGGVNPPLCTVLNASKGSADPCTLRGNRRPLLGYSECIRSFVFSLRTLLTPC